MVSSISSYGFIVLLLYHVVLVGTLSTAWCNGKAVLGIYEIDSV